MKASELILRLQDFVSRQGDCPVVFFFLSLYWEVNGIESKVVDAPNDGNGDLDGRLVFELDYGSKPYGAMNE